MKQAYRILTLTFVVLCAMSTSARAQDEQDDSYDDQDSTALLDFRSTLDPHGDWVEDTDYGTVWIPNEVGPNYTPYATAGHWVYGDDFVWISDYDWGWVPFHYGRWVYSDSRGAWAWIPGRQYAPAWVDWRVGDDFVGWAPTAPTYIWRDGAAVALDAAPDPRFVFVSTGDLFAPAPDRIVITGPRVVEIRDRTQPFRSGGDEGGGGDGNQSGGGPGRAGGGAGAGNGAAESSAGAGGGGAGKGGAESGTRAAGGGKGAEGSGAAGGGGGAGKGGAESGTRAAGGGKGAEGSGAAGGGGERTGGRRGPTPQALHVPAGKVTHATGHERGMAAAQGFSRPSTARHLGAHPPAGRTRVANGPGPRANPSADHNSHAGLGRAEAQGSREGNRELPRPETNRETPGREPSREPSRSEANRETPRGEPSREPSRSEANRETPGREPSREPSRPEANREAPRSQPGQMPHGGPVTGRTASPPSGSRPAVAPRTPVVARAPQQLPRKK